MSFLRTVGESVRRNVPVNTYGRQKSLDEKVFYDKPMDVDAQYEKLEIEKWRKCVLVPQRYYGQNKSKNKKLKQTNRLDKLGGTRLKRRETDATDNDWDEWRMFET